MSMFLRAPNLSSSIIRKQNYRSTAYFNLVDSYTHTHIHTYTALWAHKMYSHGLRWLYCTFKAAHKFRRKTIVSHCPSHELTHNLQTLQSLQQTHQGSERTEIYSIQFYVKPTRNYNLLCNTNLNSIMAQPVFSFFRNKHEQSEKEN